MSILQKYLEKIGVKEFSDLSEEEKQTYRNWEEALSGRKLTDEDVASFLLDLENEVLAELVDTNLSDKRDTFLKMQLDLIRKIKVFLLSPELEKAMTRKNIENLLK